MRSRRRSSWCSTFLFHFSSHLSAAPSKAGVCSCTVSSSCSCVRLSPFRQQGVVRPDTSVQFQKHASFAVLCWSSFLWNVATSILPFFIRSGAPTAHDVSNRSENPYLFVFSWGKREMLWFQSRNCRALLRNLAPKTSACRRGWKILSL